MSGPEQSPAIMMVLINFKPILGIKVFIGSNTALVAPVTIGDGATIGAGSTITKEVDSDQLSVPEHDNGILMVGKDR